MFNNKNCLNHFLAWNTKLDKLFALCLFMASAGWPPLVSTALSALSALSVLLASSIFSASSECSDNSHYTVTHVSPLWPQPGWVAPPPQTSSWSDPSSLPSSVLTSSSSWSQDTDRPRELAWVYHIIALSIILFVSHLMFPPCVVLLTVSHHLHHELLPDVIEAELLQGGGGLDPEALLSPHKVHRRKIVLFCHWLSAAETSWFRNGDFFQWWCFTLFASFDHFALNLLC